MGGGRSHRVRNAALGFFPLVHQQRRTLQIQKLTLGWNAQDGGGYDDRGKSVRNGGAEERGEEIGQVLSTAQVVQTQVKVC